MDVLSDVLNAVRLTGAIFFERRHLHAPWVGESPHSAAIASMVMPEAGHVISFHAILSGSCWAALADSADTSTQFNAGDIVLYPMGDANVLSSAPGMRGTPDLEQYARPKHRPLPIVTHRDSEAAEYCHLVCGYFGCDARPFNPLLSALPRLLHLPGAAERSDWIGHFIRVAVEESNAKRPGGEAVLERLSEMMFVDVVRRHLETLPAEQTGWLAGLRDRFVGRALGLLHERPSHHWTIDALGDAVGLSRSALHQRFAELVGQPPMQYLAQWRMQVASRLLLESTMNVASIALETGYDSEAAFSRAFKRRVGVPPATWRRQRTARVPGIMSASSPAMPADAS